MRYKLLAITILLLLFVVSGCVQTPAEKAGWNQAEYEEYSAFYESLVNNSPWTGKSLEEVLIDIPKDKNEFEKTWYLTFYYIKKAQDTPLSTAPCRASLDPAMNPDVRQAQADMECPQIRQKSRMEQANVSYSKAAEYRQKIEGWNPANKSQS